METLNTDPDELEYQSRAPQLAGAGEVYQKPFQKAFGKAKKALSNSDCANLFGGGTSQEALNRFQGMAVSFGDTSGDG